MDKPVVAGIGPRKKSFDLKITLQRSQISRDRSRSPISGNFSDENETFQTPPTSPSAFLKPSNQSPPSSPKIRWSDFSHREVYLKSDDDFENPVGGISSLMLSGSAKPRDVFIFPCKQISASERDKHVIKITAKLNNVKSPNKEEKVKSVLSRMANLPHSESEKVKVLDQQWLKNLDSAVQNLPESSLEIGFNKPIVLTASQKGPRVPKLQSIYDTHTPENSLRMERYLHLCKNF